jgi:hypothetical protein
LFQVLWGSVRRAGTPLFCALLALQQPQLVRTWKVCWAAVFVQLQVVFWGDSTGLGLLKAKKIYLLGFRYPLSSPASVAVFCREELGVVVGTLNMQFAALLCWEGLHTAQVQWRTGILHVLHAGQIAKPAAWCAVSCLVPLVNQTAGRQPAHHSANSAPL